MQYAELSYFEGYHFQHIAKYLDYLREKAIDKRAKVLAQASHR